MSVPRHNALALCLALLAGPAVADQCMVRANGIDVAVNADLYGTGQDAGWGESLLALPGRSWDWVTGTLPDCSSDITLDFIAGIEGLESAEGLCLAEGNSETGWLLVPGERNFRGRCVVSTCERLSMAADDMVGLTDRMAALVVEPPNPDSEIMQHPSGVIIVTAAQGWLQDAVTGAGAAAIGALLSSPVGATASAVSLLAVGGTVWVCS